MLGICTEYTRFDTDSFELRVQYGRCRIRDDHELRPCARNEHVLHLQDHTMHSASGAGTCGVRFKLEPNQSVHSTIITSTCTRHGFLMRRDAVTK